MLNFPHSGMLESGGTVSLTERQVTEFIENDQIGMGEAVGDAPLFSFVLLLLKGIDQFHRRQEPNSQSVVLYCLYCNCRRQVCLAGARAADQHDVVSILDKLAAM